MNKKQLHYDDSTKDSQSVKKTLPWSPEDIMDELHGAPIDDQMRGAILLLEMGGGEDDQGWVMDFSGKDDEKKIIISRYDVPPSRVKSKKTPSGPPPGTYSFKSSDEESLDLPSLPWVWYKDRKTFSKIETGKLSDMVAFVTGRIAASGDPSKWEGIDDSWKAAKESAEKKKKLQIPSGGDRDDNGDDEEEAVDEEAKIIATYRPEVPPRDPRKKVSRSLNYFTFIFQHWIGEEELNPPFCIFLGILEKASRHRLPCRILPLSDWIHCI